jgi:hypothetical protein
MDYSLDLCIEKTIGHELGRDAIVIKALVVQKSQQGLCALDRVVAIASEANPHIASLAGLLNIDAVDNSLCLRHLHHLLLDICKEVKIFWVSVLRIEHIRQKNTLARMAKCFHHLLLGSKASGRINGSRA